MRCKTLFLNVLLTLSLFFNVFNADISHADEYHATPSTFTSIQAQAGAGDTVYLSSGNYGDRIFSTAYSALVTWKTEPGHSPVFNRVSLNGASYSLFVGITFQVSGTLTNHQPLVHVRDSSHISFIDCNITGTGYGGEENSLRNMGMYFEHSNDVVVKGCTINGIGPEPFKAFYTGIDSRNSRNVLIEECDITKCQRGIRAWGRNWTIRKCHLHDLNKDGINGTNIADMVIEDNQIHHVIAPEGTGYHCDCIQFWTVGGYGPGDDDYIFCENITIRRNHLHDSSNQIMLWNGLTPEVAGGPGARNFLVENNLMYSCALARGNAIAVNVYDTTDLTFVNNTVVPGSQNGRVSFDGTVKDLKIANNIIDILNIDVGDGATITYEDYNIYMPGYSTDFVSGAHDKLLDDYSKLDDYFINASSYDYHLRPGSVPIGFANSTYAPTTDLNGKDRGSNPDNGCYQLNSNTPAIAPMLHLLLTWP